MPQFQSFSIYILIFLFLLKSQEIHPFNENDSLKAKKIALIFGVTGQDGAYLSEFLLKKNYRVHGVARPSSLPNTARLNIHENMDNYEDCFTLHYGDVGPGSNIAQLIMSIQPDEIYNLAAQSHVKVSYTMPEYTAEIDGIGALRILEGIRQAGLEKKTKFYQASTSELFGLTQESHQTEKTPFHPRSPYGVAKLYAYWITVNYREAYEMFACNGLLFNHESPLRGEDFVTRKITLAACRYHCGMQDILYLGNLNAKRDWGYAKDYVEAMWLMLQQEKPDDYVIATGKNHSVRDFVEIAYKTLGADIEWHGEGINEYGTDASTGQVIIKVDPQLFRPAEVDTLQGDASKAKEVLNWTPRVDFDQLVKIMVEEDLKRIKREQKEFSEKVRTKSIE